MAVTDIVGKVYDPFRIEIEKGRIAFFARAIGAEDPIYFDTVAARHAGYRNVVAPPTFGFTVAMEANQSFMVLDELGIDKTRTVHGEQGFFYHNDICAGDVISGRQTVADSYDKKGGELTFIVTETRLENQLGQHVCDLRTVIVVRNNS
jgi:acyl dehydratase